MNTLPAWMIAQDLDRYARDAMHRAALRDSLAADGTGTGSRSSGIITRVKDLRRRLAGRPADTAAACCAA